MEELKRGDDPTFDPVQAVERALAAASCEAGIIHTEATIFTVEDASKAVGAPAEEILKSILLRVDHGRSFAVALMSGINRVDTKKVRKLLGVSHVSFAGADECAEWSGFKPGGVPPVGYPVQPPTLLDEDLFLYGTVWAAAGTDHDFFPVSPDELLRITAGAGGDIKKI